MWRSLPPRFGLTVRKLNLSLNAPANNRDRYSVWESLDAHLAFRKSPSYPELVEGVKVFFASKPEMVHANLTTPCERALSAPATEIAFISLQEGSTKEELDPLVATLEAELAKAPGSHGSSWGWSVEKEGVIVGVVGWDSVAVGAVRSLAIAKTDMHCLTGIGTHRCCEGCSARYGYPANQEGRQRCTQTCAPHEVHELELMSQSALMSQGILIPSMGSCTIHKNCQKYVIVSQ